MEAPKIDIPGGGCDMHMDARTVGDWKKGVVRSKEIHNNYNEERIWGTIQDYFGDQVNETTFWQ
jgi:hypothetical protein